MLEIDVSKGDRYIFLISEVKTVYIIIIRKPSKIIWGNFTKKGYKVRS